MKTTRATPRIYLDYNATSPCRDEVLSLMSQVARSAFGNPSSPTAEGRRARRIMEDARDAVAEALGADSPSEIVFTSGGTESDNLAILGAVRHARGVRTPHVVTTAIEHYAVLNTCRLLVDAGARVTFVDCNTKGRVAPQAVISAFTRNTVLVTVMHSNNEVGTIQPVSTIATEASRHGILFHSDAVQSLGRVPISLKHLNADLVSFSGHKIGGPKGVGILYVRRGTELAPLFGGGDQERKRRPGTENVPAIAGLAQAATMAVRDQPAETRRLARLRDRLWNGLRRQVSDVVANGDLTHSLPNTLNVSFRGISGEDAVIALDLAGVAVSTGSACAVGAHKSSHVIEAMHPRGSRYGAPVRMSLGFRTTAAEIDMALERIPAVIQRLRASGKSSARATG